MNKQDNDELLNQGLTQKEINDLTQKGYKLKNMTKKSRKDRISFRGLLI